MELVRGFNFKDFTTKGTLEDTFGGNHNIPSLYSARKFAKNLAMQNILETH